MGYPFALHLSLAFSTHVNYDWQFNHRVVVATVLAAQGRVPHAGILFGDRWDILLLCILFLILSIQLCPSLHLYSWPLPLVECPYAAFDWINVFYLYTCRYQASKEGIGSGFHWTR